MKNASKAAPAVVAADSQKPATAVATPGAPDAPAANAGLFAAPPRPARVVANAGVRVGMAKAEAAGTPYVGRVAIPAGVGQYAVLTATCIALANGSANGPTNAVQLARLACQLAQLTSGQAPKAGSVVGTLQLAQAIAANGRFEPAYAWGKYSQGGKKAQAKTCPPLWSLVATLP